jgi:hypothetical protein
MHEVAGVLKHRPQLAAGMEIGELARGEAAAFQERNGERITEGRLHQGRGGRREVMRAGLAHARQLQHDARRGAERGLRIRG